MMMMTMKKKQIKSPNFDANRREPASFCFLHLFNLQLLLICFKKMTRHWLNSWSFSNSICGFVFSSDSCFKKSQYQRRDKKCKKKDKRKQRLTKAKKCKERGRRKGLNVWLFFAIKVYRLPLNDSHYWKCLLNKLLTLTRLACRYLFYVVIKKWESSFTWSSTDLLDWKSSCESAQIASGSLHFDLVDQRNYLNELLFNFFYYHTLLFWHTNYK